jgi:hypothetical protein
VALTERKTNVSPDACCRTLIKTMSTKLISSITTSFTQQPDTFIVQQPYGNGLILTKIEKETREVDGTKYDYLVGYDQHLRILFEYRACSVNVHYYYKD